MGTKRKITEDLYNAIKASNEHGKTYRSIAEFYNISFNTVEMVVNSKDYETYFENIRVKHKSDPIIINERKNGFDSYTKESEIMDIIKKQEETGEAILQQILWMTRTIGVTLGAIFDCLYAKENEKNNRMMETNLIIQNQQKQIQLLEKMIVQWTN